MCCGVDAVSGSVTNVERVDFVLRGLKGEPLSDPFDFLIEPSQGMGVLEDDGRVEQSKGVEFGEDLGHGKDFEVVAENVACVLGVRRPVEGPHLHVAHRLQFRDLRLCKHFDGKPCGRAGARAGRR